MLGDCLGWRKVGIQFQIGSGSFGNDVREFIIK